MAQFPGVPKPTFWGLGILLFGAVHGDGGSRLWLHLKKALAGLGQRKKQQREQRGFSKGKTPKRGGFKTRDQLLTWNRSTFGGSWFGPCSLGFPVRFCVWERNGFLLVSKKINRSHKLAPLETWRFFCLVFFLVSLQKNSSCEKIPGKTKKKSSQRLWRHQPPLSSPPSSLPSSPPLASPLHHRPCPFRAILFPPLGNSCHFGF